MLARKWRPQQLSELVGQEICTTIIQNMLQQNRISHAYLLTGTRGVGKTTIARIIAKMLNCLSLQETKTCNECSNCRLVSENKFIDILEIDAASNTGVDNMREILDNAQYAPTIGLYKVYIIDEAHMLSKAAFNAMLKILEEPPAKVVFMLATTEVQKVPLTII